MHSIAIASLLVAASLGLSSSSVQAPPAAAPSAEEPIVLALSPYVADLRTVRVRIGELEESFLFDTGGGATVLGLATAKRIGCTPFGRGTGFRHDGQRVDARRGGPLELSLGAFVRRGEVGVLDLDALLGGLPPVGGIVSLETFVGRAITVDLAGTRLIVETAQSLDDRVRGASELTARIARPAAGAALDVFVAIEGKHGPLWFELDSGNVAPVLVAPHAFADLGLAQPEPGAAQSGTLRVAGLGPVDCALASKDLIYDGLLNAEFFLRFVVTLDLEHGRVWARPASRK